MKKMLFSLMFLLFSFQAFAVLPPFYHVTNEIKAILDDPMLHEKLGSAQMIQEIKRVDSGYLITTQDYSLQVSVEYVPTELIGTGKFVLHFAEPSSK